MLISPNPERSCVHLWSLPQSSLHACRPAPICTSLARPYPRKPNSLCYGALWKNAALQVRYAAIRVAFATRPVLPRRLSIRQSARRPRPYTFCRTWVPTRACSPPPRPNQDWMWLDAVATCTSRYDAFIPIMASETESEARKFESDPSGTKIADRFGCNVWIDQGSNFKEATVDVWCHSSSMLSMLKYCTAKQNAGQWCSLVSTNPTCYAIWGTH